MKQIIAVVAVCLCSVGCATLPDTTYKYYPAQAMTKVSATQVFDCDGDKNLVVYYSPAPTFETKFSSNRDKPFSIDIKKLRGPFSDTDVKVAWFGDGRLKSLNADTTGQGGEIIKGAVGLIAAVGGARIEHVPCSEITAMAKGGPVVLNYSLDVSGASSGALGEMTIAAASEAARHSLVADLGDRFPRVEVDVAVGLPLDPLVQPNESIDEADLVLTLKKQGEQTINVRAASVQVASATVVVPLSETYAVPIPKPTAFGKQVFSILLNESGGVEQQGYARLNGATAALGATTAAYGAVNPNDAAIAAAAKNEADIIAQTTRLAACRKDPATCK